MTKESQQEQARQRAEMILKVRGGQITAQEAARALGISRKTYYKAGRLRGPMGRGRV